MLKDNLENVWTKMEESIQKGKRNPDDVTLVAVSKTKPVSMLQEIYAEGVRDFGENKVQELCDKYEVLPGDIRWHMIGHLQTNKVKYLIDKVYMIHSVDSYKLAEQISKEAQKKQRRIPILVEVNIAEEESKYGIKQSECEDFIRTIASFAGIQVKGLMTVAPFVENQEENRKYFKQLKQLSVDIMRKNIDNISMEVLSMGMTGDYAVAIEEGATVIRVGTGIFGERDYSQSKLE